MYVDGQKLVPRENLRDGFARDCNGRHPTALCPRAGGGTHSCRIAEKTLARRSLARATWQKLGILALVIGVTLPFSLLASWRMTALRLGEDRARSFGISVARLRFFSLLRVSLLAATSVAFVGTIGFIGLVGPHIARMLVGEDHRFFLPASVLTGAAIMSMSSVASKLVVPGALIPVGIVTALIGVPFFIALIFSRRERLR